MPKISVIIPVYNTEKYLDRCLKSVCHQTVHDIEILCINDHSTDSSLKILQKYAADDDRIKIFNLPQNQGASFARNIGIKNATGDYISFVDSDDFLETEFYEKLYTEAVCSNADIVKGAYKYYYENRIEFQRNEAIKKDKNNFACEYCSGIYKTSFLQKHQIMFLPLIDMEDPVFAFTCALKANDVKIIDNAYINICTRSDSQTANIPSFERIKAKLSGLETIIETANVHHISESCYAYVTALWCGVSAYNIAKNPSAEIAEYFAEKFYSICRKLNKTKTFFDEMDKNSPLISWTIYSNKPENYKKLLDRIRNETAKERNKYVVLRLKQKMTDTPDNVFFISVVNDFSLFNRFIAENPFIKNNKSFKLVTFDNTKDNQFISVRYNSFLNNYNYATPAWFVFCHPDWELKENITTVLARLNKNTVYGPIGTSKIVLNDAATVFMVGYCVEETRDGSQKKILGRKQEQELSADSLDCQAVIVHSSLIEKFNLRFDENLAWDLYVEDFCINAQEKHNIAIKAISIECCHHSDAGFKNLPKSYIIAKKYIDKKYPDACYSGCCSFLGGKKYASPSAKHDILSQLRKNIAQKRECLQ